MVESLRAFRARSSDVAIAYTGWVDPPATIGVALTDMRYVPDLLQSETFES